MRFAFVLAVLPLAAQINVTTYQYNNARTGANLNETILAPSNVNANQFGKLFTFALDGVTDAQPLYLSNVSAGGASHNVVYIATEHNSVYAIDADSGQALWHVNLTPAGGLYPVNVILPQLASGTYPLVITAGSAPSNTVSINVRCRSGARAARRRLLGDDFVHVNARLKIGEIGDICDKGGAFHRHGRLKRLDVVENHRRLDQVLRLRSGCSAADSQVHRPAGQPPIQPLRDQGHVLHHVIIHIEPGASLVRIAYGDTNHRFNNLPFPPA